MNLKEFLPIAGEVAVPDQYSSDGAKVAYRIGYLHGHRKQTPIDAEKSFGINANAYHEGYQAAATTVRTDVTPNANSTASGKYSQGQYESAELAKVADEASGHGGERRTADQLEIGDKVEITGAVGHHHGQKGKIVRFGKDKKTVVVALGDGDEHPFHSKDVSEKAAPAPKKAPADPKLFYIAFYDNDEKRSWIGLVTKEHGGKWHEEHHKGKPGARWGQSFEAFYTPDDIMTNIHRDYPRAVEIQGPFYDAEEADDYVKSNWGGRIDEAKLRKRRIDKARKTGCTCDETPGRMDESTKMTPWEILNKIARDKHGEYGFATLDHNDAAKYIAMHEADQHAMKDFGEFGLLTLSEKDMEHIVNKHPEYLTGLAKDALKDPSILKAKVFQNRTDESVFTNYSDWKSSVLLSHPTKAKKIVFRGKMEGEKTIVTAVIPGENSVYGEWDDSLDEGKILNEKRA